MILKEGWEKDKDFTKAGLSVGRDRLEPAFQNRLEFPSSTEPAAMVNSDFARQRGRVVLQRSRLRTGHAEPVSAENKRKRRKNMCASVTQRKSASAWLPHTDRYKDELPPVSTSTRHMK